MKTTTMAAAILSAALAGAIIPPQLAQAESPLAGTFSAGTTPPSTWTVISDCTVASNCVARVRSSDGWQSYASLNSGTWALSVYRGTWSRSSYPANPQYCSAAGPAAQISQTFTFDAVKLTGTVQSVVGDECAGSTRIENSAFSLTKID